MPAVHENLLGDLPRQEPLARSQPANCAITLEEKTGKEHLIPYIDDVIVDVDIDQKKIIINPIPGLLDD